MEKEFELTEKETYITPDIVVENIETEQNILAGGSAPDMGDEDWGI